MPSRDLPQTITLVAGNMLLFAECSCLRDLDSLKPGFPQPDFRQIDFWQI